MGESFTPEQQIVLAIAPKFSSLFSTVGSILIMTEILRDQEKRRSPYHRILLGMSSSDVLSSISLFVGNWAVPAGTSGVFGASGTIATCTAQAFVFQTFGSVTPLYNFSLSLYYLFVVRYQFKTAKLKSLEPYLHLCPAMFGLVTGVAGLFLQVYNNTGLWCWIAPYPLGCEDSIRHKGETTCMRGNNAFLYQWLFLYAPIWIVILFVMGAMLVLYRTVLKQETAARRFTNSSGRGRGSEDANRKHSTRVANQAIWYVGAFYATWLIPTIDITVWTLTGHSSFYLLLPTALCVPTQGLWNFIVYLRPRYHRYRDQYSDESRLRVMWRTVRKSLCVCEQELDLRKKSSVVAATLPAPLRKHITQLAQMAEERVEVGNDLEDDEDDDDEDDDVEDMPAAAEAAAAAVNASARKSGNVEGAPPLPRAPTSVLKNGDVEEAAPRRRASLPKRTQSERSRVSFS